MNLSDNQTLQSQGRNPLGSSCAPRIAVILALYNGAAYLAEQIDSIAAQTLMPMCLLISDDGSTDGSAEIVERKAQQYPALNIKLVAGPKSGYAANFLSLIRRAPEAIDYLALSDQDDVWLANKLERAVSMLREHALPALYGACTWVASEDLQSQVHSRPLTVRPSFQHALTQNFAAGNTMMLNASGLMLAKQSIQRSVSIPVHDWWLYQLITAAGGSIVHDASPQILYRQHTNNVIGSNSGMKATFLRFGSMLMGTYRAWNDDNIAALEATGDLLPDDARSIIARVKEARNMPLVRRVSAFKRLGLYRQGFIGNAGLWVSILLNRF